MSKKKIEVEEVTVRQFFYINKVYTQESLISTLERTYGQTRKFLGEWEEVMTFKKIIL